MKIPVPHLTQRGCRPPSTQHCSPLGVTDLTGTGATSALASESLHYIHRAVGIKSISSTAEARRFNPNGEPPKALQIIYVILSIRPCMQCGTASSSLTARACLYALGIKSNLQLIDALLRSAANQLVAFDTRGQTENLQNIV